MSRPDDEPDLRGPAAVVEGSVLGGFEFYGPFATIDDAARWHATTLPGILGCHATIVLLRKPEINQRDADGGLGVKDELQDNPATAG